MQASCPCCSGKPFKQCCAPFLSGTNPKTVKQLMRSRYSAFALGGHGEHLLRTWHPTVVPDLSASDLDEITTEWVKLEVLRSGQTGDTGIVEFRASFIDGDGIEKVHHEISRFVREKGLWYYLNGDFTEG